MRDKKAMSATDREQTALPKFPRFSPTPGAPSAAAAAEPTGPRWAWARHWEFWLALVLAAFLRLWQSNITQFLDDQAGLMQLARSGVVQGALPVTGIPSSIGTLNPPLSVYLLMPFAYFTQDPTAAVISIALWNVVGVALCYIFALRYFGRRIAAVGTLLFATCGMAINYSRFLWQQNYLPPLVVLWAITLYAGCVRGRKRWFVANATLLVIMALLHPVSALLIPVTIIGLFLAPQRPRLWEYGVFAVIVGILAAPSLIWEYLSGWSDVRVLLHLGAHGGSDLSIFYEVYLALGAPGATDFGPAALIYQFRQVAPVINIVAALVFVLGYVALTLRVWRPALAIWRHGSPTAARALTGGPADTVPAPQADATPAPTPTFAQAYRTATPRDRLALAGRWARAVYRDLRAQPGWRAHTLLWLWITIPIVGLLHHSSTLFVHYLIILYPGLFLVGAFAVQDVPRWLAGRRARRSPFAQWGDEPRAIPVLAPRWATRLVAVTLIALIAAQATQSSLYTASIMAPGFQAFVSHGYPLTTLEQINGAITTLEHQQGASNVVILTIDTPRYRAPLDYLLVSEHPDRVSVTENCLLLPAPSAGPSLIVNAVAPPVENPAAALLPTLPNVGEVGQIPALGAAPWQAYLAQGATPALPGETPLAVSYRDQQGDALTLAGAAVTAPGVIRLRWRIDAAPAGRWFQFGVGAAGHAASSADSGPTPTTALPANADCQPARWAAGETLFTWATVPASTTGALSVSLAAGTLGLQSSTIGGLRFLADAPVSGMAPLSPVGPAPSIVA